MKEIKILYEEDSTILRSNNRKWILARALFVWTAEIMFLIALCIAFGTFIGILIYLLSIFIILPTPFLKVPKKYKITNKGIAYNGKLFLVHKIYKIRMNARRKYVAVYHPLRGELIRLYTEKPNEVYTLLCKILSENV
jgi:uncharacterized membrane protein